MSLNNIYYWHNDNWQKITAEEFVKNNPDIRVSAKGQIFWCEMCGQYVTLANGDINKPHFRHSSSELNKKCEDRAKNFTKNDWINSPKPLHNLPLRICVEQNRFHFEIGLIRLPHQLFNEVKKCRITIQFAENILNYNDLSDYLIEERTTWLEIGSLPSKFYSLKLMPEILEVHFYWTEKIQGIHTKGTLFDAATGRKILDDTDIKVNTKYYLLSDRNIFAPESVTIKLLIDKNTFGNKIFLYEVEAKELSEDAAKFFLSYHCRLTANPILIRPIYPVYTKDDDIIHCDSQKIFFYFSGNAKIRFFPPIKSSYSLKKDNFKVIESEVNERRQMIAVGRSQLLQYLFVWQDLPSAEMELPKVEVKDFSGKIIESGIYHKLPKNYVLQVFSEFDCHIVVSRDNIVKKRYFINAETIFDIPDINFDTEIKILQGLDCVWSAIYEHEEKGISLTDEELFLKLERGKGKKIKIPHTWGTLTNKLKNYPKVYNWLYKSIRTGFVNEESYFLFRQFILKAV